MPGQQFSADGQNSRRQWMTPQAADVKFGSPRTSGRRREMSTHLPTQVQEGDSKKRLNPLFVEWLMGLPIGWTDLKPLEMESYQAWWLSFSEA